MYDKDVPGDSTEARHSGPIRNKRKHRSKRREKRKFLSEIPKGMKTTKESTQEKKEKPPPNFKPPFIQKTKPFKSGLIQNPAFSHLENLGNDKPPVEKIPPFFEYKNETPNPQKKPKNLPLLFKKTKKKPRGSLSNWKVFPKFRESTLKSSPFRSQDSKRWVLVWVLVCFSI